MARATPIPDRIVVGLDFGTTYSGVAWATTQPSDPCESLTTWPGGESSDKAPTKLRYAAGQTQWGFGVPLDASQDEVVEWFKLGLDSSLLSLKEVLAPRLVDHHSADALVADYLSALLTHFTTTLIQQRGREILASALDFVVAVPAMWSDAAKARIQKTCEAVSGAPVKLVTEAESAAAYAVREIGPRALSAGDAFVVVDAGGGTVDLASYVLGSLNPLAFEEAAPAAGALCGSAFLELRFAKYLRAKLGAAEGFDEGVLAGAVAHFEQEIKRLFTIHAPADQTYPLPVPGLHENAALGIADSIYALPVSDIHIIFEPVIRETVNLVREQVASLPAPPRAVLLVGGFGGSDYLLERLREALDGVEVLRPPSPWRAVAQGAVIRGLETAGESMAGGKRERRYGMEVVARYDESVHASIKRKKYWCGLDGCYKVFVMQWFTQDPEKDPLETTFTWTHPASKGRARIVKLEVYVRDAAGQPPLSRDSTVTPLRRVEADLGSVPERELERRWGLDGRSYYDIRCGIEGRVVKGARCSLVYKGRKYEATTVEYA